MEPGAPARALVRVGRRRRCRRCPRVPDARARRRRAEGVGGSRRRRGGGGECRCAPHAESPPPPPGPAPALKAFSGKGWRRAAPGFGDPEDRDALPPSREPKVLVGNLPTDVPPGVVREILQSHCDGMDLGDVPGELSEMYVAVFGPARPKLKRDRGRLHRGFALLVYTTREAAEAAATRMHGVDLHTPSKKTEGGMRPMKATADVGPAMDAAFMAGEQGDDAPPPAPAARAGAGAHARAGGAGR